jgi:hypothetical protein
LHPNGSAFRYRSGERQALELLDNGAEGALWTSAFVVEQSFNGDIVDDGQPLQRYATRVQWQRLLEQAGFDVMRVIGYEFPPPETLADWWRFARQPRGRLIPTLIWPFIPVNLASNLVFFCRRAAHGGPS